LRCGPFDIRDAVSIPQLEDAFRYGYWQNFVYPIDSVLSHLVAIVVTDDTAQGIRNGRPLVLGESDSSNECACPEQRLPAGSYPEERCRAYALDGRFLAVLRFDSESEHWQPEKVFL